MRFCQKTTEYKVEEGSEEKGKARFVRRGYKLELKYGKHK